MVINNYSTNIYSTNIYNYIKCELLHVHVHVEQLPQCIWLSFHPPVCVCVCVCEYTRGIGSPKSYGKFLYVGKTSRQIIVRVHVYRFKNKRADKTDWKIKKR